MRTFALALIALSIALAGCGGDNKPAPKAEADTTALATPADTTADTTAAAPAPAEAPSGNPVETKPAAAKTVAPAKLPMLWDFSAEWCPPCKQLKPIIAELEKEYDGRVLIRTIDTDVEKELAREYGIQAIPTLVYLDASGKELDRSVGLVEKSAIVEKFKTLKFIQ